jgi:hypothetical protein
LQQLQRRLFKNWKFPSKFRAMASWLVSDEIAFSSAHEEVSKIYVVIRISKRIQMRFWRQRPIQSLWIQRGYQYRST